MPLFTRKGYFAVRMDPPGRLVYSERNLEFTFPVYESNRQWILVDEPTAKRIHLFFGWHRIPVSWSESDRERILPRLLDYLKSDRQPARIFDRGDDSTRSFSFYPELFDHCATATDLLGDAGLEWLTSYSSIDLLHEEYGLEVCGIQQKSDLELIASTLREGFPHWHYCHACHKDGRRDPGWKFAIHMYRRQSGAGRCIDAD